VPNPTNASSVLECACEAGYTNSSSACGLCALAIYKPALGNATCTACLINTNTTAVARVGLDECLCAQGFCFREFIPLNVTTFVNVARACGVNQDEACPALASGSSQVAVGAWFPSFGNNNTLKFF